LEFVPTISKNCNRLADNDLVHVLTAERISLIISTKGPLPDWLRHPYHVETTAYFSCTPETLSQFG
jgi:hypothetical protein